MPLVARTAHQWAAVLVDQKAELSAGKWVDYLVGYSAGWKAVESVACWASQLVVKRAVL